MRRHFEPTLGTLSFLANGTTDSYVYVSQVPSGATKIGKADSVKNRLSTAQTDNHELIECKFVIVCGSPKLAYKMETLLHHWFKPFHIHGEWFNVDPVEVKKAAERIAELIELSGSAVPIMFSPPALPAAGIVEVIQPNRIVQDYEIKKSRQFKDLNHHLAYLRQQYREARESGNYNSALDRVLEIIKLLNLNDVQLEVIQGHVHEIDGLKEYGRYAEWSIARLRLDDLYECANVLNDCELMLKTTDARSELLGFHHEAIWLSIPEEDRQEMQSDAMDKIIHIYIERPKMRPDLDKILPALKGLGVFLKAHKKSERNNPDLYDLPLFAGLRPSDN